jgi:predicted RNA-binding protein with PUA-like domain
MKSEASSYDIADLERDGRTGWDGVRNYQARNSMDAMKVGDLAIFYHSNGEPSGAAGVMRIARTSHPDPTAWDRKDKHYDPRSTPENPVWRMVEVEFVERFPQVVPLASLKGDPGLEGMLLLSGKAMRLSVQPLDPRHFDRIVQLGRAGSKHVGARKASKAAAKAKRAKPGKRAGKRNPPNSASGHARQPAAGERRGVRKRQA